ncbi:MAG: putative nitrogenase iron-molybdenum protein beta chain [Oscillospiraceae bacterium]|nr:putative nitrogenase iron-molybdenum protein beta chain [Oscillospiraceae bacterium]
MSGFIERPRTTCSLGGALAAISSLPGVVPISHTASGCAGNLGGATAANSGYCGSSYCSGQSVPVSNISEQHVIFGGGNRLEEEIRSARELLEADLFVVTTGCMTEIIADDVSGVVSEFQDDGGAPVICINTPSFEADAYGGYEILLHALFNEFLPVRTKKRTNLVNLFGVVPLFDPFFRGDLEELKRLLHRLGLQVNTFFTADQAFADLKTAPEAALNLVLSSVRGVEVAQAFQERHGTPYLVTELPVGAEATEEFLLRTAQALKLN